MPKDNGEELFYLVDDSDQVLGPVKRSVAHQSTTTKHRSVFVLLFNDRNELLLQKRSQEKDTFPGFWTLSASGHVAYGQSYDEAAKREMMEEIGLDLALKPLQKIYVEKEREFVFIYRADCLGRVKIDFDQDEVAEVRWVKLEKLAEFIEENEVTPAAIQVLGKVIKL